LEKKEEKVYGLGETKKFGFTLQHLVGVNLDPDVWNVDKLKLVFDSNYLSRHLSQIFSRNSCISSGSEVEVGEAGSNLP
jgi:hypothetical protein